MQLGIKAVWTLENVSFCTWSFFIALSFGESYKDKGMMEDICEVAVFCLAGFSGKLTVRNTEELGVYFNFSLKGL